MRRRLTTIRDQFKTLLDKAVWGGMTLRDALALLSRREIAA